MALNNTPLNDTKSSSLYSVESPTYYLLFQHIFPKSEDSLVDISKNSNTSTYLGIFAMYIQLHSYSCMYSSFMSSFGEYKESTLVQKLH